MLAYVRILRVDEEQGNMLRVMGHLVHYMPALRSLNQMEPNITNLMVPKPKFVPGQLVKVNDPDRLTMIGYIIAPYISCQPEARDRDRAMQELMHKVDTPRFHHRAALRIFDNQGNTLPALRKEMKVIYGIQAPFAPDCGRWSHSHNPRGFVDQYLTDQIVMDEEDISPMVVSICSDCGEYRAEEYPCPLCGNIDGVPTWVVAGVVTKRGSDERRIRAITFDKPWVKKTVRSKFREQMSREGFTIINAGHNNQGVVSFQPNDYTRNMGRLIQEALDTKAEFERGWTGNR